LIVIKRMILSTWLTRKISAGTNLAGQATKQASSWSPDACQGGVKTPAHGERYKREHCVWNWSTKNPSRPAHSTSTPQHQHIAPAPAHHS
jgi:hypothetical protein